jgi:hypothetical protein
VRGSAFNAFPWTVRLAHERVTCMNHNKTDFAYQLVYRYLLRLINEHYTGPAVRLPSLRLLARRLRVSISTVQNAVLLQIVNDYVNNWKNNLIPCG